MDDELKTYVDEILENCFDLCDPIGCTNSCTLAEHMNLEQNRELRDVCARTYIEKM